MENILSKINNLKLELIFKFLKFININIKKEQNITVNNITINNNYYYAPNKTTNKIKNINITKNDNEIKKMNEVITLSNLDLDLISRINLLLNNNYDCKNDYLDVFYYYENFFLNDELEELKQKIDNLLNLHSLYKFYYESTVEMNFQNKIYFDKFKNSFDKVIDSK